MKRNRNVYGQRYARKRRRTMAREKWIMNNAWDKMLRDADDIVPVSEKREFNVHIFSILIVLLTTWCLYNFFTA